MIGSGVRGRLSVPLRRAPALVAALVVVATVLAGIPPAPPANVRELIVSVARRELADGSRNHEYRGSDNCTYYSGQVTDWPPCGPAGWRGGTDPDDEEYAWCANFVRYVWRTAGVTDLRGLDAWARSFHGYGIDNGTWHGRADGYLPQPGDSVVFDGNLDGVISHVGVVTGVAGGRVQTIEGNSANRVAGHDYGLDDPHIVGYASPVGAPGAVPSAPAGHGTPGSGGISSGTSPLPW